MCLAQGPQRSDAGEARTRYPSVSSQARYHWATALPVWYWNDFFSVYDWIIEMTRLNVLHMSKIGSVSSNCVGGDFENKQHSIVVDKELSVVVP